MTTVPSWCAVGVQVVCIMDDWEPLKASAYFGMNVPHRLPMLNEVLTIKKVIAREDYKGSWRFNVPACGVLTFDELGHDWAFASIAFRPLVTRTQEQDIAEHFSGFLHGRVPEDA